MRNKYNFRLKTLKEQSFILSENQKQFVRNKIEKVDVFAEDYREALEILKKHLKAENLLIKSCSDIYLYLVNYGIKISIEVLTPTYIDKEEINWINKEKSLVAK